MTDTGDDPGPIATLRATATDTENDPYEREEAIKELAEHGDDAVDALEEIAATEELPVIERTLAEKKLDDIGHERDE